MESPHSASVEREPSPVAITIWELASATGIWGQDEKCCSLAPSVKKALWLGAGGGRMSVHDCCNLEWSHHLTEPRGWRERADFIQILQIVAFLTEVW